MPEVIEVNGWWALLAGAMVGALGFGAAVLDGALAGRARGLRTSTVIGRPFRETARLLRQRRTAPLSADRLVWRIGGGGLLVAALLMVSVIPLGGWTLSDLDVGVVWINTVDIAVWGFVWLAGWGANSPYPLVAGHRFLALALGYELPLMFALVAPSIAARSLRVGAIVDAQSSWWNIAWMPVAFVVYCLGVLAFSVWGPFSAPVGSDLAGGVRAELTGVDRLLVDGGRFALLVAGSAVAVALFLGGGSGPLVPGWVWTPLKTALLVAALLWVGRRIPRLRPDLLLEVGWLVLLPAAVLQDLVVSIVAVSWR